MYPKLTPWLESLAAEGLQPICVELASFTKTRFLRSEQSWIDKYQARGEADLNCLKGNFSRRSTAQKLAISKTHLGKPKSKDHILKMSEAAKKRWSLRKAKGLGRIRKGE